MNKSNSEDIPSNRLNAIFISPPFGQFFKITNISPIHGSYTLKERPGRYIQAIRTIRPLLFSKMGKGNFVNKISLRNPGIDKIPLATHENYVLSIAAIEQKDWLLLVDKLYINANFQDYSALEINIGCPNTTTAPFLFENINYFKNLNKNLIIKLPPKKDAIFKNIREFIKHDINTFHLSNTFPTKLGGLSGQWLRKYNLRLINRVQKEFGEDIRIIAGGGVHCFEDALEYLRLRIQGISMSTICYYPWRVNSTIVKIQEYLAKNNKEYIYFK